MVRPDRIGPHRVAFEKNKKKIFKTQNICGICGSDKLFNQAREVKQVLGNRNLPQTRDWANYKPE